jgi:GAF domain-containing protein
LEAGSTWEGFAKQSLAAGFPSVCAIPLRLKHEVLGCLTLFMSAPVPLSESDVVLARALADVASIALVQDLANREAAIRETHLQNAFRSRTVIEQAKGMIAQHCRTDLQRAFEGLRKYARDNNRQLTDVAESVVAGRIATWAFASKQRPPPPPSAIGHR